MSEYVKVVATTIGHAWYSGATREPRVVFDAVLADGTRECIGEMDHCSRGGRGWMVNYLPSSRLGSEWRAMRHGRSSWAWVESPAAVARRIERATGCAVDDRTGGLLSV